MLNGFICFGMRLTGYTEELSSLLISLLLRT